MQFVWLFIGTQYVVFSLIIICAKLRITLCMLLSVLLLFSYFIIKLYGTLPIVSGAIPGASPASEDDGLRSGAGEVWSLPSCCCCCWCCWRRCAAILAGCRSSPAPTDGVFPQRNSATETTTAGTWATSPPLALVRCPLSISSYAPFHS